MGERKEPAAARSQWKRRKWETCGASEEEQTVPKSIRSPGSVKAPEFPAKPEGSNARWKGWRYKENGVEMSGPEVTYTEFILSRIKFLPPEAKDGRK